MSNIFDIVENLAVPSADDGVTFTNEERLKRIRRLLRGSSYKQIEKGNLFRLYAKKRLNKMSNDIVLISSHVDCLQEYKCFGGNEKNIHGIFDNAVTNAVIVRLMLEDSLPDNVVIGFTGDEERNSGGAKELAEFLKNRGKLVRFIVLDVTSSGWDANADFTIENNFWKNGISHTWAKRIITVANELGYEWRFISAKVDEEKGYLDSSLVGNIILDKNVELGNPDYEYAASPNESWEYESQGLSGFSLCIPCSAKTPEEMHDNKGFDIRRVSLVNYTMFLKKILNIWD